MTLRQKLGKYIFYCTIKSRFDDNLGKYILYCIVMIYTCYKSIIMK